MTLAPSNDKPDQAKEAKEVKAMWIEYQKTRSEVLRNKLVVRFTHLVRYNAERIHVKLPNEVELDDLISAGVFGLFDAIKAFNLDRGVKFETYCAPRIRGAILDSLRAMDWVPRLVRSRSSKHEAAKRHLEADLGRQPTREEMASYMNIDLDQLEKIERDCQSVGVVSLSRKWFETDSNKDVREIDVLEDSTVIQPLEEAERKDLLEKLLTGYNRAERLIIILYYFEEMTMKEIGNTLDLSESRVSQMHSGVLSRMRAENSRGGRARFMEELLSKGGRSRTVTAETKQAA